MILYFLRHGDAVRGTTGHDSERPLSDLGLKQAAGVGRFLNDSNAGIQQILCSPFLRARQTAESIQQEIGSVPVSPTDDLVPSGSPRHILRELKKLNAPAVLLVGHEPHLSETISVLLSKEGKSRVEMKPCSLACLTTEDPVKGGQAILHWLLPSDQTIKWRPDGDADIGPRRHS